MDIVVGNRLRQARTARQLSLNDVAGRAKISVATLSRIERDKQGIDLGLFLTLSKILKATPHELLGDGNAPDGDPLALQIASLETSERAQLWRELTSSTNRNPRGARGGAHVRSLGLHVDELLAHIEFLHAEIESVQRRLRRR